MSTVSKRFTQIVIAGAAAMTLSGCMGNTASMGMDPRTQERVANTLGPAAGAAIGASLTNGGSRSQQILGAGAGAAAGAIITDMLRPAPQPCNRTIAIDNLRGTVTADNSRCNIQHGVPVGTPAVRY